ncbi:Ku protein [Niveispirillum sp.]|uniref:non-homologous end joining protein Ku n=1 Tax=Niveispirillum sp. TaxID=1917217 RepID=UPI001B591271|nr:Ku protein [Niveispirillum sp.]MBP7340612.1 Ku protein [Niveispirillum sp.]
MAPHASWNGVLLVGELSVDVSLYAAASSAERMSFHIVNRRTGHRVRRELVDQSTGRPVEQGDQLKGYDVGDGRYLVFEPAEVAAILPKGDRTMEVEGFIDLDDVDPLYFDRPYFLGPRGDDASDAFRLVLEGMRKKKVAALARAVLFRRLRSLLIWPGAEGFIARTLNFDHEVETAPAILKRVAEVTVKKEMLDLARHIIDTKAGTFDPATFDDRYDAALADLVRAKIEGKPVRRRKPPTRTKPDDLLEALRRSAEGTGKRKAG